MDVPNPTVLLAVVLFSASIIASSSAFFQYDENSPNHSSRPVPFRDDKTLAIIRFSPNGKAIAECTLFDLEKHAEIASQRVRQLQTPVVECNFSKMMSLIDGCRNLTLSYPMVSETHTDVIENVTELWSLWRGIIPGTKWCGLGDEAKDYNDIGTKFSVDNCCRSHDHCPIRIKPFRFDYGLVNLSYYTRSHCECDDDFLRCLKATRSPLADVVGDFYFNIMKFGCMKEAEVVQPCYQPMKREDGLSVPCPMERVQERSLRSPSTVMRFVNDRHVVY